ncbi:MAG: hypothetical protein KGJ13_11480 [Patescibacteria group bacterium]|nr:hypothetical protein [Patescibacteria group bacterium]
MLNQITAGVIRMDCNTEMVLRDKYGNLKPIWQDNELCIRLIKSGKLNPLWINQWYAFILKPFLGRWSYSKKYRNLVPTAGKGLISGLLCGSGSPATPASIGQGTGTNAAASGDTALQTEVKADGTAASGLHVIAAATVSLVTGSVTNDTAQWVGTVNETASIAITESGVFNATTNGTLLARQTFTAVNVVNGDTLQFTWQIKNS